MKPLRFWIFLLGMAACSSSGSPSRNGTAGLRQQAALDYPTFRSLEEAVVTPICGPRGGVCHNSKQFPDLHTPENMLAAVGQRCNQLTDDPKAIQNLCEPQGDL